MAEAEPGRREADLRGAVRRRATALVEQDVESLRELMDDQCVWTTYRGDRWAREEYIERNTTVVRWRSQEMDIDRVVFVGDVGVVLATARDIVVEDDAEAAYAMPVTMTWLRSDEGHWQLVAGHAGPLLAAEPVEAE